MGVPGALRKYCNNSLQENISHSKAIYESDPFFQYFIALTSTLILTFTFKSSQMVRAIWEAKHKAYLLDGLIDAKVMGKSSDSGFKKEAWESIKQAGWNRQVGTGGLE